MAGKKHLIVGAGTAGYNAIRTLRQMGSGEEIALVSAEHPYSRMVLPYYLERGISEGHATTLSFNQLEAWGVELHVGRRAVSLDPKGNTLKLDNEDELEFDDVLIATGSSPVKLDIPGANGADVHSFWSLADAQAVNRTIGPDSHVVMVGAGFIAFTILNGVLERAGRVTLVEAADRILPRMVDETGAGLVSQWLEERGVTLRTGARLRSIEDQSGKKRLVFEAGDPIEADLVVMATGVRPNLDWLDGSGITINGGIVVDERLRSNLPHVYAAGDVAEGVNRITGAREVHAIEPTAMEHGRVVGANMAGKRVNYPGSLMMNIVSVAGLDIASFGAWDDPGAEAIETRRDSTHAYRRYLLRENRITGAIYIGSGADTWAGNDLGMLKGLVQSGADLSSWRTHLERHPFDLKKPYLASRTVSSLMPMTILGDSSPSPR